MSLGATQRSKLALGAGLEPAADFRQMINSHPPATNSGTLEKVIHGHHPFHMLSWVRQDWTQRALLKAHEPTTIS